jgi:hypothetical protein
MDSYTTIQSMEFGSDDHGCEMQVAIADACPAQPEPQPLGPEDWPPYIEGQSFGFWTHEGTIDIEGVEDSGWWAVGNYVSYRPAVTWFDPGVDFREPAGDAFAKTILDLLPQPQGRGRRVNRADLYAYVRVILANGLRCHYHRTSAAVTYNRAFERRASAPAWPSGRAMSRTTDKLAKMGLLTVETSPRKASVYAVTDDLLERAAACGVTRASLAKRLKDDDLVRLYAPRPKRKPWEPRIKGERIDFAETDQTRQFRADLKAYNDFLFQHAIGIDLSPEEEAAWAASLNKEGEFSGTEFKLPELLQTDVCRIFNNGVIGSVEQAFDEGGRLYTGWWINAPKALRSRITIDGSPTMELDYSGYHINMLYHERGLECVGYPYDLPDFVAYEKENGLSPGTLRPCAKVYTNALINCKQGGRPSNVTVDADVVVPAGIRPVEIIRMIEQRHDAIKDAFRSNAGLRLQRIDSDIAMEVITTAMVKGGVVLPVHDSFIAKKENKNHLKNLMDSAYNKRFGHKVGIK